MLALLLAATLIALTILALLLAGVLAAVVTGVGLLNLLALLIGLRSSPARPAPGAIEDWRPKSFRRPPAPPLGAEAEEHAQSRSPTMRHR